MTIPIPENREVQCHEGWEILVTTGTLPGYWGRGRSIPAAVAMCRRQSENVGDRFVVFLVPPGAKPDNVTGQCIFWKPPDDDGPDQVLIVGEVTVR